MVSWRLWVRVGGLRRTLAVEVTKDLQTLVLVWVGLIVVVVVIGLTVVCAFELVVVGG